MARDIRSVAAWTRTTGVALAALASLVLAAAPGAALGQVVRTAVGPDAAGILPGRDLFRLDLGGGTTAGANGSFGGVRREINWDGVPAGSAAPNNLPANFFNTTSPRGVTFSTPGAGFQVSGAATDGQPTDFGNIDPTYTTTFAPFSPARLFTALASNVVDVNFFLPGTTTPALTRGFGAVFSDVDLAGTTSISFFGLGNVPLGTFFAQALAGSETFSFLGVSFADAIVSRVRITSGNAALGAGVRDGNGVDLVVMDDFIYGEPQLAVTVTPEPATLWLFAAGLLVLGGVGHLRRKGPLVRD
jgi:hypothetical protein